MRKSKTFHRTHYR